MYIPLRNHSAYSLLESSIRIPQLIQAAKSHRLPAVGLCDQRHMFSAMEFSMACKKADIFPILGCNIALALKDQVWNLGLWIQTQQGYHHLCQLITHSTLTNTGNLREKITLEQLLAAAPGLILTTGGMDGPLYGLLAQHKPEEAQEMLDVLNGAFQDRVYIELQRCHPKHSRELDEQCIQLAYRSSIPLLASNPAFFMAASEFESHDALRCIALGRYVLEEDRPRLTPEYRFKTPQEMQVLFSDVPEALDHTRHLFQRIGFLLETSAPKIPSFPCPDEATQLRQESDAGLEHRLAHHIFPKLPSDTDKALVQKRYRDRLIYERSVIESMGFAGYFLIVSDFIRWAKHHQIPVGPGRGSGASSLVAFCLDITDVDPVEFDLVFERFLNPERISMPDFDVDFCQERRDEVIAYVAEKYGKDRVAHIITFGTLQARVVLRDVGRVLQMPYSQVDKICKLIPHNPANPVNLSEALRQEPLLAQMWEEDEHVRTLIETAKPLEGLYRHAATHAAGVIISDSPLTEIVPLYQDENSTLPATEFSMKYIEACGLVKFDFLGLKTLTILQNAVNILKSQGVHLELTQLTLYDEKTYALLRRVETVGIFQLESTGMSDVLRQLQPESFEEIVALVALYRPGPMDDIPRYIACRHQREAVTYEYPALQDILKSTFGVMVYQEQVLKIAQSLAGYTLGEADMLRRAMGKKIKSEMDAQRGIFVERILQRQGGTKETARHFFDQIARFAGYAFPKAHSVPYALISYQTAYLKANYPVVFMTSLMNCDIHNTDKLRYLVTEAKRMGLIIAAPDVNYSNALCIVDGENTIRYGLVALKNVGLHAMEVLQHEREARGKFTSLEDFIGRVPGLNKKLLEALIMSGALDSLHKERSTLMRSIEHLLKFEIKPQVSTLFPLEPAPLRLQTAAPWSHFELLEQERQSMGFYFSDHPLTSYTLLLENVLTCQNIEAMTPYIKENKSFRMIGMVMEVKEKTSKSGKKYAFVTLSDAQGTYEVTVFSDVLQQSRSLLTVGQAIDLRVLGRIEEQHVRYIVQHLCTLSLPEELLTCHIYSMEEIDSLQHFLAELGPGNVRIRCIIHVKEGHQVSSVLEGTFDFLPHHKEMWKTMWREY